MRRLSPALLLLAACTASAPEPQPVGAPPPSEAVPYDALPAPAVADDVVVLDAEPCFEGFDRHGDDTLLRYGCPVAPPPVGAVLVSGRGAGLLVRAVEVEADGMDARVATEAASLADVFADGGFLQEILFFEREVFSFSGTPLVQGEVGGVRYDLAVQTGAVAFQPKAQIGAEFGFFSIKRVDADLDAQVGVDLVIEGHVDGAGTWSGTRPLGSIDKPFSFMVGPVPITGALKADVVALWSLSASGALGAAAGVNADAWVHTSAGWDGDWRFGLDKEFRAEPVGPDIHAEGEFAVRVELQIDARLELFGSSSAGTEVQPWLKATGHAACETLDWTADAGADAAVQLDVSVFGKSVDKAYGPWSWTRALGAGSLELPIPLGTDCGGVVAPPADSCTPSGAVACGQTLRGDTALGVASLDAYPVNIGNYDAPELVYAFTGTGGVMDFSLVGARPTVVNHDIVVLDASAGTCLASDAVAWGFNTLLFESEAGHTYHLVVDGYDGDAGDFELKVDCD